VGNTVQETGALALVGPGRAGTTLALGLAARGWTVVAVAGRTVDAPSTQGTAARLGAPAVAVEDAGRDADLVIVATPDGAVAEAAGRAAPSIASGALVIHLAGSLGLDALDPVPARRGALHPLMTIPAPDPERLRGAWCAVAGDPQVEHIATGLGMRPFPVADEDRAAYHAAACIASNHLVALLAQVERVSPVPLDAMLPLVRATVDNVEACGSRAALTGPIARGDVDTVARHLAALGAADADMYRALAREAHRLAGRDDADLAELLG
jgi:predicted short-subunit dehydrogenase-like oxidoreductase (DUF2520 family)